MSDSVQLFYKNLDLTGEYLCSITDPELHIILANDHFRQKFGNRETDFTGKNFPEIIGKAEMEKFHQATETCLRHPGLTVTLEIKTQTVSGELSSFRWEISALLNQEDEVAGVRFLGTDTTKLKKYEQEIFYQAGLLDSISDAVISTDPDFIIKSWNRAAADLYLIGEEDALGKKMAEIVSYRYQHDTRENSLSLLQKNGYWKGDVCFTRRDGTDICLQASVTSIRNKESEIIGYVSVNRRRKEIEPNGETILSLLQENQVFINSLAEGLVVQNEAGEIILCNSSAEQILGLTADQMRGRTYMDPRWRAIREDGSDFPGNEHPAMVTLATGKDQVNVVMGVYKPDGPLTWIRINSRSVRENGTDTKPTAVVTSFVDITETIQAYGSLHKNEQRLKNALLGAGDGVWEYNFETGESYYSDTYKKILGFGEEEFKNEAEEWRNRIHPDDLAKVLEIDRQYEYGIIESHTVEYRLKNKEGDFVWILDRGMLLEKNIAGKPLRVIGTLSNIHDKKLSEQIILSGERRFRETLEKIGDNAWEHDFRSGKTVFSVAIREFLGYSAEELSDNVSLWWNSTHPDDRHLLEENDRKYRAGEIEHHTLEYRIFHKDGSIKWVLDRGVVIEKSENNLPLRIVGTHSDITESRTAKERLKESESRLSDLIQNVPGVIYQWEEKRDGSFGFRYVSPKLKEYFGLEPEEMDRFTELIHPEDRESWRLSIEEANRTGKHWTFEGRLLYPDGTLKWWRGISTQTGITENSKLYNGIVLDITENKLAEEKLKTAEKRFSAIFNSTYQFIGLMDPDGTLLEANQTALDFAGLKPGDVIGKPFWECYWWQTNSNTREKLQTAIREAAKGAFIRYEVEVLGKNGSKALIDFSIQPLLNEEGKVILLIPEGRDISQVRKMEKELLEERVKLASFLENCPTMAWIMDEDSRLHFVNKQYMKVFGITEKDIGKSVYELFPRDICDNIIQNNFRVWHSHQGLETIEEAIAADGSKRILQVFKFPMGSENGKRLLGGNALDITQLIYTHEELEKSNERFQYVTRATSDAIWDWQIEENRIFRMEGFKSLFGYEDLNGSREFHLDLVHPDDQERVKNELNQALKSRDENWQAEYHFRCFDGKYKNVLDKAYILRGEDGTAKRMIGAMQDISEQRRLENQLKTEEELRKKEIMEAVILAQEREREELSIELHDNVNQILSSGKLFLEMAARSGENREEYIEKGRDSIRQAIDEIRKISHGLNNSSLQLVGLDGAIADLADQISMSGKLNISFIDRRPDEFKNVLPDIELALFRITQEQLNNILKHSRATEVSISLLGMANKLVLNIDDNGIGFNPSGIRKGLGLNNIVTRAEHYGGDVNLISTPGNGCLLSVAIPCL